jgi:hypothetical protein
VADRLGVERMRHPALEDRITIARFNDDRLPTVNSPRFRSKKGEIVHLATQCDVLVQKTTYEWRGSSRGVSFPIAPHVRVRTGSSRGRSVAVGTELARSDHGVLFVTSLRSVFLGGKSAIEVPHPRLLSVTAFHDALQLHVVNRSAAPLFRTTTRAEVVCALLRAAANRATSSQSATPTADNAESTDFPKRFTQQWLDGNIPGLTDDSYAAVLLELRQRNWTESDLDERVYPLRTDRDV